MAFNKGFAMKRSLFILSMLLLISSLWGQGRIYEGPDDPAGDIAAEREGYMTGNRVFLYFRNTTELSDWPKANVSRWPNNYQGVKMTDGVALLVGARVYITQDTIPVTEPLDIFQLSMQGLIDTVYFLQTSYREEMDRNLLGDVEWGFYPVFGYFNESSEYPAMSNKPSSWPTFGWPAAGNATKWPGEWNGRFGKGVIYADLETYFVVNDAQDLEYCGRGIPGAVDYPHYYPRPGVRIGDKKADVTIQRGNPWGGLGIRVETRGFQWNNPQARDAIFFEYSIANISEYDIRDVGFGYWVDNAIGGEGADDELGFFDVDLDMAYSWDKDGMGLAGAKTGTMGFAYLESPGLPYDGMDNDNDGIIDERRDNGPGILIEGQDAIRAYVMANYDLAKFEAFYGKLEERPAYQIGRWWTGDEDMDWQDGEDLNGDGFYDITEYAGDDLGLDGIGPGEINYPGPDEGEGNHRPDYVEGVGCEPNFAATDVSESDMVGLTSFRMFPVPSHSSDHFWFKGDKSMWELVGGYHLEEYSGNVSNLIEVFASGPFPLFKGHTERVSMSMLHSYDPLEGLNSESHTAPALFELKKIVQVIYEKDYRFAQPPKMPTLTATPGDGKVILVWDDIADTRTRDPFVGNVNDFEGYKVYRATDKKMSDAEVITDGYGTPMFLKPIFQCDLIDTISGFTDFGLVNGMGYYLGSETGITHHFVDNNVENGRSYYYAIVAYDYGAPHIGPGIAPSENNIVIELDEAEEVTGVGKNVAIVTPRQNAAGYMPTRVELLERDDNLGQGELSLEILAEKSLKLGHIYHLTFDIDTLAVVNSYDLGLLYTTSGFHIYDATDNAEVYSETPKKFSGDNIIYNDSLDYYTLKTGEPISSDIFDGMRFLMTLRNVTARYDFANSGWITGNSPMRLRTTSDSNKFPWDYQIVFSSSDSYTQRLTNLTGLRDENGSRIASSALLSGVSFPFYVLNKSFQDSSGNDRVMDMVVHDLDGDKEFDILKDRILVGDLSTANRWVGTAFIIDFNLATEATLPKVNDVYQVKWQRPFFKTDTISFTVVESDSVDISALKETMANIRVVPNPYIATNAMEPAVANQFLNQRRRLMFTNLPAECNIHIFTPSGILVDKIEVRNDADNGIIHWDLTSREGLEIAAGMYVYHVESTLTSEVKIGKFAVIK